MELVKLDTKASTATMMGYLHWMDRIGYLVGVVLIKIPLLHYCIDVEYVLLSIVVAMGFAKSLEIL